MLSALTNFTVQSESILRHTSHFEWSILAFIGLCLYVYAVEVQRQRWDIVLAGLAFWFMDWFNELINSAILHVTHHSALWTVTGPTSYLILIGLSIEISLLFLILGVIFVKMLPKSRELRILGIPNRVVYITIYSCLSVVIEIILHSFGVLHWAYWWWNVPFVPLIIILGYATFYAIAAWVFDLGENHVKQLTVVGSLAGIDILLGIIFGLLGWL